MENSAISATTCEGLITMPMAKAVAVAIFYCSRALRTCAEMPDTQVSSGAMDRPDMAWLRGTVM